MLCVPGLEPFVLDELGTVSESAEHQPWDAPGSVLARSDLDLVQALSTADTVVRPLISGHLERDHLDDLQALCLSLDWGQLRLPGPFRVTAHRRGEHSFGTNQIQATVGAVVGAQTELPVDLTRYETDVRVDLWDSLVLISLQLHKGRLSQRSPSEYQFRAACRESIAAALVRATDVANIPDPVLLDPCCGSGTLLFEAARANGSVTLLGSDARLQAIEGTEKNLASVDLCGNLTLRHARL
ncbi:MAG: hypothetical protein KC561_17875, partial [Myxococcales bacterium]|nr:hypothetical protein [Myxococcales bacterium]